MAESTISKLTQPLKVKAVNIPETLTLNADGYLNVQSYMPADMNHFLFAMIGTWSSNYPKVAFTIMADGRYLVGTSGAQIAGLQIRYFYTD